MDYQVKGSGVMQQFNTGAVRDTQEGKGRFDLIPAIALIRMAKHFENGAKRYGENKCQKVIPIKRVLDSAIRHMVKYMLGDRSEDHIIAAAWNCFVIAHTEDMIMDGGMDGSLAVDLPCHIVPSKMDSQTRKWWKAINARIRKARKKKQ